MARQGGRGDAQIGASGLPAVVQLRAAGFVEQFQRRDTDEDLHRPGNGQLADRHLQRPDERQTQGQGALPAKPGVRTGREDAAHRQRGEPLLHAADARQPIRRNGGDGGQMASERRDDARHEGCRTDERGCRGPVRGQHALDRGIAARPGLPAHADREQPLLAAGRGQAAENTLRPPRTPRWV